VSYSALGRYRFAAVIIALFASSAGILAITDEPSSEALRADIVRVQAEIDRAAQDSQQYAGGLIKSQIELRRSLLETTKAMLEQKEKSWLRRFSLTYTTNMPPTGCACEPQLAGIDAEITGAKERVASARQEAARYSGGLLLALIETRLAQEELTLASLETAKVAARYGVPFVTVPAVGTEPPARPVDPSHDKEVL